MPKVSALGVPSFIVAPFRRPGGRSVVALVRRGQASRPLVTSSAEGEHPVSFRAQHGQGVLGLDDEQPGHVRCQRLVEAALVVGDERGEPCGPFCQCLGGPLPAEHAEMADRAEELGELPAGLANLAVQPLGQFCLAGLGKGIGGSLRAGPVALGRSGLDPAGPGHRIHGVVERSPVGRHAALGEHSGELVRVHGPFKQRAERGKHDRVSESISRHSRTLLSEFCYLHGLLRRARLPACWHGRRAPRRRECPYGS